MWYLSSHSDSRFIYITAEIKEIIIGRSMENCTFAIPEDASISRKHAMFSVSADNLILQDLGSRYGTFVNNFIDRIGDSKVKLNINDVVKFGKLNCVWKVCKIHFITCTSTLRGENLQMLKDNLNKLGGLLQNEWDDSCAYLTMPAITLTIKVVLALMQGSQIVTPEFWSKCIDAVNKQTSLPNANDYTPKVVESTLNKENVSFRPNHNRSTLFTGKKFIFFSRRQLEMYKTVVLKGSATPILLSESQMTKSMLVNNDIIVIQYNPSNISQETQAQRNQINDIVNYIKSKGKRVIADAEIGLAVLYCSVNKYCNPSFSFSTEMLKQSNNENVKTNVLAHESEEITENLSKKENTVIDESLTTTNTAATSSKRKLSEDDGVTNNINKKIATDSILKNASTSENYNAKRKLDDSNAELTNPNKKIAVDFANDDDDFFNFINPVTSSKNENNTPEKKLNFSKPFNNKLQSGVNDDEDDLFNFIEDKSKTSVNDQCDRNVFNIAKNDKQKQLNISKHESNKNENIDISAMRGIKLKELMSNNKNANHNIYNIPNIKKEVDEDLDNKMNSLNIGCMVIKVRSDLIVKKEPLEIVEQQSPIKNFKKFKKVWPVKMQVTVIPKSSMSISKPNTTNVSEINSVNHG